MKNILLFVLVLVALFSSCQQNELMEDSKAKVIIGKWQLYETVEFRNNDDSIDVKCTICPEFEFSKNHSGFIKSTDGSVRYFSWVTDDNNITIKSKSNNKIDDIIGESTYNLDYYGNLAIKEITLTDSAKNIKYILSK